MALAYNRSIPISFKFKVARIDSLRTEPMQITAASILTWFVVDSLMSAATGMYANIFGNMLFLILFEVPLVATYNTVVRWPKQAREVPA